MSMKRLNKKGFTLIEVLIGAIVISIVSVAAWTGFSSLQIAEEQTRNRTTATNLLQLSQEEVRNFAQNTADFDRLETCHFPPATPDCNLSDPTSTTPFSGFTRTMTAAQENSSPELKRVHTVVQWTERGSAQQMESVILLSRPGTSIPGNLIGIVSSTAAPGTPLNLTTVKLTSTTSTATYTTNSSGSLGSKNANYDFMDPVTGKYLVPAGAYTLTANRTGYQPYTYGSPINIPSSGEIRKDFELTPVPADAVIHGTITGGLTTFNYGQIWLYENGAPAVGVIPNPPVVSNSTSYSFTIPFSAPGTTRSFTIATIGSWKQGYVYDLRLGTSCSLEYSANGYSTAWVSAGGGVNCDPVTHPYLGNSGSDRIMVGPGVNRTEDLPLVPIPEVTLTGTVKDNLGDPIIGATVLVMWPASGGVEPPNWYRYWRYRKNGAFACNPSFAPCDPDKFNTKTVAGGRFSINVPAVQGVAPNITPAQNYLQVSIGANLPSTLCCGQTVPTPVGQNFNLPWPVILGGNLPGSLFPTTGSFDLGTVKLSPLSQVCGNVIGNVKNDATSAGLAAVDIQTPSTTTTNGSGDYRIECPPTAPPGTFVLPAGQARWLSLKSPGFYTNTSQGNFQYAVRGSTGLDVNIPVNAIATYNAKMWPVGYGNLNVKVEDFTSGDPLEGMPVIFKAYDPALFPDVPQTTAVGTGIASFTSVLETWPAPATITNPYYNHGAKGHKVVVNCNTAIYKCNAAAGDYDDNVPTINAGSTTNKTIRLKKTGGGA